MADMIKSMLFIYVLCFVAPSSCLVTEWGEWDICSATCGLGMKRRERMVKMPPSDGSICEAEVVEVEKCMMPECRELKLTNHLFFINSFREAV